MFVKSTEQNHQVNLNEAWPQLQRLFQLSSSPKEEEEYQRNLITALLPSDWVVCTVTVAEEGSCLLFRSVSGLHPFQTY